jgi:hypothetical protein
MGNVAILFHHLEYFMAIWYCNHRPLSSQRPRCPSLDQLVSVHHFHVCTLAVCMANRQLLVMCTADSVALYHPSCPVVFEQNKIIQTCCFALSLKGKSKDSFSLKGFKVKES